jgi:hypothetical protein
MKEFDYDLAKKGRPVKTRDGRPARIISFDCKDVVRPIVALVETKPNEEEVLMYSPSGKTDITEPRLDLVMRSEKHEGWVNIRSLKNDKQPSCVGIIFTNEDEAKRHGESCDGYITSVKIEWEE